MNACVENAAPDLFSISRGEPLGLTHAIDRGERPRVQQCADGFDSPAVAVVTPTGVEEAAAISPQKHPWFLARWVEWNRAGAAANFPHVVNVAVDNFFASVEQVLNPRLAGKAVIVGREVVVSASREARAMGVKTAMSFCDALRVCPRAIMLPGQYGQYADFAERMRRILQTYSPAVESSGMDDFYVDFAGTEERYADYEAALRRLQVEILECIGLSVSLGAARTKALASIASRLDSSRGLRIVPPAMERSFLAPLPVETLRGIEQVHAAALAERGVSTIGQLRMVPKPVLTAAFGAGIGEQIWKSARGLHSGETALPAKPRSISRESAIDAGTTGAELLGGLVEYLSERIGWTLRQRGERAQAISLWLRYGDDFSAHRTVRLMRPTNDPRELLADAKELLATMLNRRVAIRHICISVTKVEDHSDRSESLVQCIRRVRTEWSARLLAIARVRVTTAYYAQR
jgi:DNA polymerase-4